MSRQLAAAQTIAVVEAGGRTVSLADLLGPEFFASPAEMFPPTASTRRRPATPRAASALLSSAAAALGCLPAGTTERPPDLRAGEGVDDVAHAAARAVAAPGTEVSGTEVGGSERGPRGRWAVLLRHQPTLPWFADGGTAPSAAPHEHAVPEENHA
jgi:hypothetical protein